MSENNEFTERREDLNNLQELLATASNVKKSERQAVSESKLSQLLSLQQNFFNNQIKRINERAFIEFNVKIEFILEQCDK